MAIHIGSGGNDTMRGRDRAADDYRDFMYGRDGDDNVTGGLGSDRLHGEAGNDMLIGGIGFEGTAWGDDYLFGGPGNDVLVGIGTSSTLYGGPGDDFYVIDVDDDDSTTPGPGVGIDYMVELPGEGHDQVIKMYGSHSLGPHMESLRLADTGRPGTRTGQGNELDNRLIGSSGQDILLGYGGDDTIRGEGGNDFLSGDAGQDILRGGDGSDELHGGSERDLLWGGAGDDRLFGGDGADFLDGGTGVDHMVGGAGDDFYFADQPGDRAVETQAGAEGGTDTVYASTSWYLRSNVEHLVMVGDGWFGWGNRLDNRIEGNAADNLVHGAGGNDRLFGFRGDDHIVGGPGLDRMSGGPGDDTFEFVRASDSYLPDEIVDFESAGSAAGDVIDLRGVDADATQAGNQAFTFHGATPAPIGGLTGGLRLVDRGDDTMVVGFLGLEEDVLRIVIEDGADVRAADYSAEDFVL